MPRQCSVCQSGHAAALARLVSGGMSKRDASERLGLGYESVKRHFRESPPAGKRVATAPLTRPPAAPTDDPCETFERAFGYPPMPHQTEYLTTPEDTVFLKGRQVGATQCAAGLAIHVARTMPGSLSAIISPSMQQSTEVAMRARLGLWELGERLQQDSNSLLRLANGSRIKSLPGTARAVRGYSADLLVLDEAAWISDETWTAGRPITSATGGRTIVQSTPGLPVGWFYDMATQPPEGWHQMRVTSEDAPTVDHEFLARERARLQPHLYDQEYGGEFASVGSGVRWFPADEYDRKVNPKFAAIRVGHEALEES